MHGHIIPLITLSNNLFITTTWLHNASKKPRLPAPTSVIPGSSTISIQKRGEELPASRFIDTAAVESRAFGQLETFDQPESLPKSRRSQPRTGYARANAEPLDDQPRRTSNVSGTRR